MIYLREIKMTQLPKSYVVDIPAVRSVFDAGGMRFQKAVTFFVGENGTGKSTLLEAIAAVMGFNAEGGAREHRFSTRHTHLDLSLSAVRGIAPEDGFFLRAESFYNFASYLDESGSTMSRYGGRSLHGQSHGEAFLSLVTNRFTGRGLYILDEPESALSPQRLLTLLVEMDRLVKNDSQFIIATHSPILMACPDAQILQFSASGIEPVAYKETEHYKITKEFINAPERMLHYLLDE